MIHHTHQGHQPGNWSERMGSPLFISVAVALWLVVAMLLRMTYWS
jgi:hypothetical protein